MLIATSAAVAFGGDAESQSPEAIANTNAASGIVFQKGDKKIIIGAEVSGGPFGLPKDVLDKLSPEQLIELERLRRQHSQFLDTVVPIGSFAMILGIVALVLRKRLQQARLLHETIRAMIEKGQPIPPELLQPPAPRRPRSDLRRGLVFLGIGAGLTIWLAMDGGTKWALGLIPLLMGVAFLITWKVEQPKNGDKG
ncbi:MAG: DUF6249 domain-containing protein [Verrucomicrobiae bacterium]|nr:DUF6249 domain-containing protein [Verrucomicrobiae bacterium]